MILVVLFFVLLTASALLSAYAPRITHDGAGTAVASLLFLALFFFLVSAFYSVCLVLSEVADDCMSAHVFVAQYHE
jgi:hypothetical protein